jgi:hypothetical protein
MLYLLAAWTQEVVQGIVERLKALMCQPFWQVIIGGPHGDASLTDRKLYTCTDTIAMTDAGNIQECKVVRKPALGEMFEASVMSLRMVVFPECTAKLWML